MQICDAFRVDREHLEPLIASQSELLRGMELLSIPDVNVFELEEIFEDGKKTYIADSSTKANTDPIKIPLRYFIAGSEKLRSSLLALPSDPVYCSLLKTQLRYFVSNDVVKVLSEGARLYEVSQTNKMIYSSDGGENVWFAVLSGKLQVKIRYGMDDVHDKNVDLCEGELFGGCLLSSLLREENLLSDALSFQVDVIDASKYVELSGDRLMKLKTDPLHQSEAKKLIEILSGSIK